MPSKSGNRVCYVKDYMRILSRDFLHLLVIVPEIIEASDQHEMPRNGIKFSLDFRGGGVLD